MIDWFAGLGWHGLHLLLLSGAASQVLQWTLIVHVSRRIRRLTRARRWPFRLTIASSVTAIVMFLGGFALWFVGFGIPEFTAAVGRFAGV